MSRYFTISHGQDLLVLATMGWPAENVAAVARDAAAMAAECRRRAGMSRLQRQLNADVRAHRLIDDFHAAAGGLDPGPLRGQTDVTLGQAALGHTAAYPNPVVYYIKTAPCVDDGQSHRN